MDATHLYRRWFFSIGLAGGAFLLPVLLPSMTFSAAALTPPLGPSIEVRVSIETTGGELIARGQVEESYHPEADESSESVRQKSEKLKDERSKKVKDSAGGGKHQPKTEPSAQEPSKEMQEGNAEHPQPTGDVPVIP